MQISINSRGLSLKAHTTSASSSASVFLPQGLETSKPLTTLDSHYKPPCSCFSALTFLCVFCVFLCFPETGTHIWHAARPRAVNLANLGVENGLYLLGKIVAFPFLTWHWQHSASLRVFSNPEVPISQQKESVFVDAGAKKAQQDCLSRKTNVKVCRCVWLSPESVRERWLKHRRSIFKSLFAQTWNFSWNQEPFTRTLQGRLSLFLPLEEQCSEFGSLTRTRVTRRSPGRK